MNHERLKDFLEKKYELYNNSDFIENDPISIPHQFSKKEDIEIAAFLAASISWGNRKSIIKNSQKMMDMLDNDPFDFIVNHQDQDLHKLSPFVHRTFNLDDFKTFIQCLKNIYLHKGGLESVFTFNSSHEKNLTYFPNQFFYTEVPQRTKKHIAKISTGSAAKRINMFLRWMSRKDDKGVDFGLWSNLPSSKLFIPLDVHSGNSARKLGLLSRSQNDWKSVVLLTEKLREFDSSDPVKYDFALFGIGAIEKIT